MGSGEKSYIFAQKTARCIGSSRTQHPDDQKDTKACSQGVDKIVDSLAGSAPNYDNELVSEYTIAPVNKGTYGKDICDFAVSPAIGFTEKGESTAAEIVENPELHAALRNEPITAAVLRRSALLKKPAMAGMECEGQVAYLVQPRPQRERKCCSYMDKLWVDAESMDRALYDLFQLGRQLQANARRQMDAINDSTGTDSPDIP
ncbi:hypothetical protein BGZ63DRAFT_466125 [Mariannaea sp. PMI_226]|nr:hypothetical protein BGZ63DRAFT_466125 [Mariannaea sp. PMI_226]